MRGEELWLAWYVSFNFAMEAISKALCLSTIDQGIGNFMNFAWWCSYDIPSVPG